MITYEVKTPKNPTSMKYDTHLMTCVRVRIRLSGRLHAMTNTGNVMRCFAISSKNENLIHNCVRTYFDSLQILGIM